MTRDDTAPPLPWWAEPRIRDQDPPLALVLLRREREEELRARHGADATDPERPTLLFGLEVRHWEAALLEFVISVDEVGEFESELKRSGDMRLAYLASQRASQARGMP